MLSNAASSNVPKRLGLFLPLLCLLCYCPHPGHAQAAAEQPLNPHRYPSPLGHSALEVDPTQRFGESAADYRLTRDGVTVWSARLPFTLREAVVAEDGTAAGYAYSSGLQGGRGIDGDPGLGSLRLVILDPRDGHARLQEKIERKMSMAMHAPPVPTVDGLLLDEKGRRFVAITGNTWRVYRLTDGRSLRKFTPSSILPPAKKNAANLVMAARMVPGTPLALVQWETFGGGENRTVHFALLDLDHRTLVWSTDLAAAHLSPATESLLRNRADRAILAVGPADSAASRFAVWSANEHGRVNYHVTRQGNGSKAKWSVEEESRSPLAAPAPDPTDPQTTPLLALPATPDATLKPIGVFQFPAGASAPPAVRAIRNFGFDGQGNIGLLRVEGRHAAFVWVDPKENGAVRREIELPTPDLANCTTFLAWLGGSRWLLIVCRTTTDADSNKSLAWTVDTETGAATPRPGWNAATVRGVSGTGDGRFVVLDQRYIHHPNHTLSMPESLSGFGPSGQRRWTVEEDSDTLFSPQDVAVLSDGKTAAVVETIRNDVLIFDLDDGKLLRTIDLKKAWGREPRYPAEITADQDGGFVIGDWQNSTAPYVRAGANGEVRAALTPRYADGRAVNGGGIPMRADPAGRVWMCDRDSLLRLDATGRVDLVLGEPRESGRLGAVAALTVGNDGRLYAVDARNGDVHVFDDAGQALSVCRPTRQDVPDQADTFNVAVTPDHHVFLGAGRFGLTVDYDAEPAPQIEFGADGQRLGARQLHLGKRCIGWQWTSDGQRRLVSTYADVRLVSTADAKKSVMIDRQFDRRWLCQVTSVIAGAADGTFALVSALQGEDLSWAINLYNGEGKAQGMIRLPPEADSEFVACDGRRFVTRRKGADWLMIGDVDGHAPPRGYAVELPAGNGLDASWTPIVVRDGRELWLVSSATKTVARFAWPP